MFVIIIIVVVGGGGVGVVVVMKLLCRPLDYDISTDHNF